MAPPHFAHHLSSAIPGLMAGDSKLGASCLLAKPLQEKKFAGKMMCLHESQLEGDVYAIIQTGGRQVRVTPGATVEIDGTAGEAGKEITFGQVLMVEQDSGEVHAGAPFLANARVVGIIDSRQHGPKIRVFKKKRRKGMRRTKGHRAQLTRVRIKDIVI